MDHIVGDITSLPGHVNRSPLAERLSLDRCGDVLTGHPPHGFDQRLFGGQLLAQVLLAAAAAAPAGRVVESLNAHFLRPGRPDGPIRYPARVIREGRTRSVLAVQAEQGERELVAATVSLGPGDSPATTAAPASAPDPESLPDLPERRRRGLPADGVRLPPLGDWRTASRPLDVRPIDEPDPSGARRLWVRAEPVPGADDHLQRALLAYASDRSLLQVIARTRGAAGDPPSASVDHAMWFHATPRAGDWYLYVQDCPFAGERGGLARGTLSDQDGRVVASVAQHGVLLS